MRRSRVALGAVVLTALVAPDRAAADDNTSVTGINVERFVPAIGPGALLGIDGAGAPAARFAFAASISHASGQLTIKNRLTGDEVSRPVRTLTALDLGAEATLFRGFSVGIGLPIAVGMSGDRLAGLGLGDERPLGGAALGDLRLRLRYHLGALTHLGGLSLRGQLDASLLVITTVPLGGEASFFATSGPTIEPRVTVGWSSASGWVRLVGRAGYRLQPERHLYDLTFSHAATLAIGLDLHVPRPIAERFHLLLEQELLSWRGGLRVQALPWLSVDAGVGTGLGVGEPRWRLFAVVRVDG